MKKLLVTAAFAVGLSATAASAQTRPFNWTGSYIGVQGGYAWGSSVQSYNAGTTNRYDIDGVNGGLTIGYNYQANNIVLGIEADLSLADTNGIGASTSSYGCGSICASKIDWFGTIRGRLGYARGNWLFYGTGGFAYANLGTAVEDLREEHKRNGWAAGVGIEVILNQRWTMKLEYMHLDFNTFVWTNSATNLANCAGISCSTDARLDVFRVGMNYRFGR